jgi:hypothetical protein
MSPNVLSIAFALLTMGLSFAEARRMMMGGGVGTLGDGAFIAVVVCIGMYLYFHDIIAQH